VLRYPEIPCLKSGTSVLVRSRRLRQDFAKDLPVLGLCTAAVAGGQALERSDQLRIMNLRPDLP
jgi:DUF1009 family protein